MPKKIFVDTSAFLVLANQADQYHQRGVECFQKLRSLNVLFITTNFILDETYTRLQRRAGLKIAISFGEKIQSSKQIKIHTLDKKIERLAWNIFKHDFTHSFSYTDCTSFALMRHEKISEAFCFDEDFEHFGWLIHPKYP